MHSTIPSPSRLPADFTNLPSGDTFGELSDFLRSAIADEDTNLFADGMRQLSEQADAVACVLRQDRHRDAVAPLLMDMLTMLRDHRNVVLGLGLAWRGLYEYAGYLQGLTQFRLLIGGWLLNTDPWDNEVTVTPEDFERLTWRTLGDGVLLIDMYEHWLEGDARESRPGAFEDTQAERARQWWRKLRR